MTETQLITRLKDTYKDKYPEPLTIDLTKWLSGFSGEQIDEIYEHFTSSSDSKYPPSTVGVFKQLARENGISKDDEYRKYYVCKECKYVMSMRSQGCHECGSRNLIVWASKEKQKVKPTKDHCYKCSHYSRMPQGPSCNEWGIVDNMVSAREGNQSRANRSLCNDCICKFCCAEEYAVRNKDRDRVNNLSGNFSSVDNVIKKPNKR